MTTRLPPLPVHGMRRALFLIFLAFVAMASAAGTALAAALLSALIF